MTTSHPTDAPNHHVHHPAFHGATGLLAALSMTIGRAGDADLAVELTGLAAGDRLVDVGCGPGTAVRRAARLGATAIGVDPAPVMLSTARRLTGRGSATYVEGRAEALPLSDGSAGVLWSLASVHHWPDVDGGLAEAHRVLEPGGRFLAMERHTTQGATGLASHGWTDEQAEAFARVLAAAGFDQVRVERRPAGRRALVAVVARRP